VGHVIEAAASGRAGCRGCGKRIEKGELRLGERLPNPFAEGEMTLWFHLRCGAYKRPEALLAALDGSTEPIGDRDQLATCAAAGIARRRLPRVDGAERASSGRARCRSCRETIAAGTWRIRLVFFEDGRFEPSGFVHAGCSMAYFETVEILDRVKHFAPGLSEDDLAQLRQALDSHA
jgi:hypothetical protein